MARTDCRDSPALPRKQSEAEKDILHKLKQNEQQAHASPDQDKEDNKQQQKQAQQQQQPQRGQQQQGQVAKARQLKTPSMAAPPTPPGIVLPPGQATTAPPSVSMWTPVPKAKPVGEVKPKETKTLAAPLKAGVVSPEDIASHENGDVDSRWRLVWCFEHCFSGQWAPQRAQLSDAVTTRGGELVCLQTPTDLGEFLNRYGPAVCAVMLEWSERFGFLEAFHKAERHLLPKYVIIRCPRPASVHQGPSARAQAQAWLQVNPLPQGVRYYLCSDFGLQDANIMNIMKKASKLATQQPRGPLRPGLQPVTEDCGSSDTTSQQERLDACLETSSVAALSEGSTRSGGPAPLSDLSVGNGNRLGLLSGLSSGFLNDQSIDHSFDSSFGCLMSDIYQATDESMHGAKPRFNQSNKSKKQQKSCWNSDFANMNGGYPEARHMPPPGLAGCGPSRPMKRDEPAFIQVSSSLKWEKGSDWCDGRRSMFGPPGRADSPTQLSDAAVFASNAETAYLDSVHKTSFQGHQLYADLPRSTGGFGASPGHHLIIGEHYQL